MTAKKKPTGTRSLVQFHRDKRRQGCPVCSLDPKILEQLRAAASAKIQRPVQLEWLRKECGVTITDHQLTAHYSGRHDAEDA